MTDSNVFPKGTYIVLLSSCEGGSRWGDSIPNNHIYQLKEDSTTFYIMLEKDCTGSSSNGWIINPSNSAGFDKMKLRRATEEEIAAYREFGPCNIEKAKLFVNEYQIY